MSGSCGAALDGLGGKEGAPKFPWGKAPGDFWEKPRDGKWELRPPGRPFPRGASKSIPKKFRWRPRRIIGMGNLGMFILWRPRSFSRSSREAGEGFFLGNWIDRKNGNGKFGWILGRIWGWRGSGLDYSKDSPSLDASEAGLDRFGRNLVCLGTRWIFEIQTSSIPWWDLRLGIPGVGGVPGRAWGSDKDEISPGASHGGAENRRRWIILGLQLWQSRTLGNPVKFRIFLGFLGFF